MKNYNFATATRLDLEIWDTQNKIKYIKLPTRKPQKCHSRLTKTNKKITTQNKIKAIIVFIGIKGSIMVIF